MRRLLFVLVLAAVMVGVFAVTAQADFPSCC